MCTLRVGFSPSWRVSGSERDMLGTSNPPANAGAEDGGVTEGDGVRMIGGVGGGVGNGLEVDVEGFEEASKPDTRFPEAHSKSSALSPGRPAFHLNIRPSAVANILDWPLHPKMCQLYVSVRREGGVGMDVTRAKREQWGAEQNRMGD